MSLVLNAKKQRIAELKAQVELLGSNRDIGGVVESAKKKVDGPKVQKGGELEKKVPEVVVVVDKRGKTKEEINQSVRENTLQFL